MLKQINVGKWHNTSACSLLQGWHNSIDPSELGLQDYSLLHPILHSLVTPHKNLQYWFSEANGHGIYPPADLDNITWSTVLNTVQVSGNYHVIQMASTTKYTYISVSLNGCPLQAPVTEYIRISH